MTRDCTRRTPRINSNGHLVKYWGMCNSVGTLCEKSLVLAHFRWIYQLKWLFLRQIMLWWSFLMIMNYFRRTPRINQNGRLVNYWGMCNCVVTYLAKIRDFRSFQVNLPAKMNFLHPLQQKTFIAIALGRFRMAPVMRLHGYLVTY